MSAAAFILSDSPRKCKFLGMLKLIKELKKYIYKKENNEARGKPKFNFCFIFAKKCAILLLERGTIYDDW